ncbi:MAG TPA: single-stranded-DNA-specific exonuclease RecJ [Anaerolineales bacterium]|nr:single-stranded-DNA-specific exonuclease RecJ [Anaerolineales bacterium]
MNHLSKRWQVALPLTPEADDALQAYPFPLRQILFNRGYTTPETAHQFLEAAPPPGTDPFRMTGMQAAVSRLEWGISKGEKIAIYGDYDADGVTATALLVQVLQELGAQVTGYIPNRFDEGYGLNKEALDNLCADGIKLVVTVDCGVRSIEEAEHAKTLGLDLIITDHHHTGREMPVAVAVINPKQPGDSYPDKDLAGVGLAYKLASALVTQLNEHGYSSPHGSDTSRLLDLVALGTVSDLAPLVGENRSLVRDGIQAIRRPSRQGLFSLIKVVNLNPERITASEIGYVLGPRLNAAGRLDSALAAFKLLTTNDLQEAGALAQSLDKQNKERQRITREIQAAAEQIALAEDPEALLLFAAHPDFNRGVVGLAASRLTELYYRPSIVAHRGPEFTRGSCRSIQEFHITQALDRCEDLLEHHGGHAAAAGFTVRNEYLPELVERLQKIASESLAQIDLRPSLHADAEIPLVDLKPDILQDLDRLQPTGYGNPQAVFLSRGLKVRRFRAVGEDGHHLKMTVTDGKIDFDAIAFRQGYWQDQLPPYIDLMYTFEINEYNGFESLQLNVRDIKPAGLADYNPNRRTGI